MCRTHIFICTTLLAAIGFMTTDAQGGGTNFTARPHKTTIQKCSSWMLRLPDSVQLSRLSLPGTHDSCALRNGPSFGFAKCQTWQLGDQLKAGIRFIDIRCRHVSDELLIYHGVVDQKTTFREVRDVCREFLKQHPSECILMSVKEESTAKDNSRSFAETFADLTESDGKLWHVSREIPQLGSVRNRIVLVDRVGTLGGLQWAGMERQDRYNASVELKTKLIRSHLEKASSTSESQWFINFCSGTVPGSLMTPRKYALQSNEVALKFLRQLNSRAPVRLGTIVMDFPGEELIERIVKTNFSDDKAD
jgi:1-phosphatidylinositol phosphodiesterase